MGKFAIMFAFAAMLIAVGRPHGAAQIHADSAATEDTFPVAVPREPFNARRILELLYINRPDSALTVLRWYQRANPKDPYVLLLRAKVMRERLNDEDNNKELIRRSTGPIHAVLDSAIALANEGLSRDLKDYRHYYYRGYGWLSKSQLYVLTRSYWSAGRAASHGKDDLEEYLDKHPDDADARGALGAYFYFADAIPGFVKIVAKLLLIPGGDREKGLDMLRFAVTHEGAFSVDWKFVMAAIDLVFEGNFEKGTDEFAALLKEYPLYTRLAEPIGVVAPLYPARVMELREIAGRAVDTQLGFGEAIVDWSLVKRIQLFQAFTDSYFGRISSAVDQYEALVADPPRYPDWVLPIALLNLGYLRQKQGKIDEARKAFEEVRSNARMSYYRRAAETMRSSIDKPVKKTDLPDLDFILLIYRGEFDEATRRLESWRSAHGEDAMYDFYTGEIEALKGDLKSSKRSYERSLSRESYGGDQIFQTFAAARLAEISGAEGRYSEARDLLKRAQGYCHANYLLDFLLDARERYYRLIDSGKLDGKPALFAREGPRGT